MGNRYAGYERRGYGRSPLVFAGLTLISFSVWFVGYLFSVGFPVYGEVNAAPLWNAFCEVLTIKEVAYLTGFLLMLGGAFLLQKANYELGLIREKSQLPLFLNIFLISINPYFFPVNPASFSAFFLIVAIYLIFRNYHSPDARSTIYQASLVLSLGSLLWVQILWFVPLLWYGIYRFRIMTFRIFLASLMGFATIYWFLLGWCVWIRDFSVFEVFPSLFRFQFIDFSNVDYLTWIGIIIAAVVTLIAIVNIITHDSEDVQRTREFLGHLILLTFWSFGLMLLFEQSTAEFLQLACIPSSVLMAHFFTLVRNRFARCLFWLMLGGYITLLLIRLWNFL